MIATSAGIASNELTALRRMAISQPNAPPSVRGLTCLAAHCRRGARTQTASTPVPLSWRLPRCSWSRLLHRLVLVLHFVCTETGACGICLVRLRRNTRVATGLWGLRMGPSSRSTVAYRCEARERLAHEMPPKAITLTPDATLTGTSV